MTDRPLGERISHMLHDRGVRVIFGIPGVHNLEMYRGIESAGIRHILARHEQGAGFMADGYARATGRPGVAYVITGPGLLNILTPLGQAYSDSVPVLVISSCLDPEDTGVAKGKLHEMRDQLGAAATVCDWSKMASDADAAYHLIDRALTEFQTQRARPKQIQVPLRALAAPAPAPHRIAPGIPRGLGFGPIGRLGDVTGIAELFKRAERPLFVFGGGAVAARDAARRVLSLTKSASFVTMAARGLTDPADPLAFGSYLSRPGSAAEIAKADLVIAVGTELAETDLWRERLGHQGTLVRVDIDPASLSDRQGATVMVLADARFFLNALADLLKGHDATKTLWHAPDIAAARARWRTEVDQDRPHILPVIGALRAALPKDTTVYSDMTQFAYVAVEVWDMEEPGLWHHPFGFGTLGYALPAAIGGKVGLPDKPVVAILGDYGLQYTLPELGTAVELGLPLPILVWDNGALGEIRDGMVRSQIAPNAVVARNPDFLALARAYGAHAAQPATLADLARDVHQALAADRPTLIRMTPALAA
jgi:acetolactate synthase-1/2/3 large subunit/5-guanidino-2-oxopentanoate decarboxylase